MQRSNIVAVVVDVITATVTAAVLLLPLALVLVVMVIVTKACQAGYDRWKSMQFIARRLMRDTHEFAPVGLAACSSHWILDRTTDDLQLRNESDPISIPTATFAHSFAAWRRRKYYKLSPATADSHHHLYLHTPGSCALCNSIKLLRCCIIYAKNVNNGNYCKAITPSRRHAMKSTHTGQSTTICLFILST